MGKQYVIDNPTLMAEWNWEKNDSLNINPRVITITSKIKAYWRCPRLHDYQARIEHRYNGSGCPYCSGRYAIKGENDLQTVNPSLAKEWNLEKNKELMPADFLPNSGKKVWWRCEKGHEWQATIASRNNGCGCPICLSEKHTSFPEYALVYYLENNGIDIIHSYKGKGYEIDIYIPTLKIGIEYDGYYWHKDKAKKDLEKNLKCKQNGIKLYRIREGLPSLYDSSIDYIVQSNLSDLEQIFQKVLFEILEKQIDVNLKRDAIAIDNIREYTEKENSLLVANSKIASEWNYEKNGSVRPEDFTEKSGKSVWWKCEKGHGWQAKIANRANGRGCPYCSGQKVLQGFNDLATVNSSLIEEWNYEKNGSLKPENFTANSGKNVWWICRERHDYQATIINKNKGAGCPYCSNQKLLPGYNDLATRNPALASEWDYELNKELKPTDVFLHGHQQVWWKCSKGHPSWKAKITNRANGQGCSYCAGKQVLVGQTDLQTVNSSLAAEWNYSKNEPLRPTDVLPNSNKKVWWICKKGHSSWPATIASRNSGMGCPYCSNHKVLQGYNDLATQKPLLAKEWNYDLNGSLRPENVTSHSGKKYGGYVRKGIRRGLQELTTVVMVAVVHIVQGEKKL